MYHRTKKLFVVPSFFLLLVVGSSSCVGFANAAEQQQDTDNTTLEAATTAASATSAALEDACGVEYYNFGGSVEDCHAGNFNFDGAANNNGEDDGPHHYHLSIIADGACRKSGVGLGYHRAYCTGEGGIFFTEVHCTNDDCTDCGSRSKTNSFCTNQDYPKPFDTYDEGFCHIQTCDDPDSVTKDKTIVFAIEGTCNPDVCPKYILPELGDSSETDEDIIVDDGDDTNESFTTSEIVVLVGLIAVAVGCCFGCRYMCCSKQTKENAGSASAAGTTTATPVVVATGGVTPTKQPPQSGTSSSSDTGSSSRTGAEV